MSETLNFTKLADAPVLDEVPDGAKVYAEVDGKVYRVAGDNLGGGVPTAILKLVTDAADEASVQSLLSGGAATVSAGDNARAASASTIYTATCDNMTFDEVKAIFLAGGQVNARLQLFSDEQGTIVADARSIECGYFLYNSIEVCGFFFVSVLAKYSGITFCWLPDGMITTDMSALGG